MQENSEADATLEFENRPGSLMIENSGAPAFCVLRAQYEWSGSRGEIDWFELNELVHPIPSGHCAGSMEKIMPTTHLEPTVTAAREFTAVFWRKRRAASRTCATYRGLKSNSTEHDFC